jgi:transposase-like protein
VKVKGCWKYLYRAVDKAGATVDFLLTAKRDCKAALRFLRKAIGQHGVPEKITIDKSGANTAAIESYNTEHETGIEIRRIKYLNNIVEQDHRAVKRLMQPMLGFKSFRSAAATLSGIELMHMIRKGQLRARANCVQRSSSMPSPREPRHFHTLVASINKICDATFAATVISSIVRGRKRFSIRACPPR